MSKSSPRMNWHRQLGVLLDLRLTLVGAYLGYLWRNRKRRLMLARCHWWAGLHWAKEAAKDREWWLVLDHLLHAVEYPIPDCVLEFVNWRARFCTWATVRYL